MVAVLIGYYRNVTMFGSIRCKGLGRSLNLSVEPKDLMAAGSWLLTVVCWLVAACA